MTEMGEIRYGNSVIPYKVSRSARRKKTIEITLDAGEGVLVAAPVKATKEQIESVVSKRAPWIAQRSIDGVAVPRPKAFVSGETLPYMGREVRLDVDNEDVPAVRIRFSHWAFRVTVPRTLSGAERQGAIHRAFSRWYRRRAAERIRQSLLRWEPLLGVTPRAVKVRDQRQRWGSCAPDGTLRFHWRIAMADSWLLDYVVVHELCHLEHRNHSRDFWAAVERAMPDYKLRRLRLKEVGPRLTLQEADHITAGVRRPGVAAQ